MVVFLLFVILYTLHFFGAIENEGLVKKTPAQKRLELQDSSSTTVFQRFELFKSQDNRFHFSYPSNWYFIDTTTQNATKEADLYQSWTISDNPGTWNIKADFIFKEKNNEIQGMRQGTKEEINGYIYNVTEDPEKDGIKIKRYQTTNRSREITIFVKVISTASQEQLEQWQVIENSFRFFE